MVLDLEKSDVRHPSKGIPLYRLLKRRSILIEGGSVHSRFEVWVWLRRRRRRLKDLERLASWELNTIALEFVSSRSAVTMTDWEERAYPDRRMGGPHH